MEQQVNLFQPILGAEKRLFSAVNTAVGLGVMLVSLLCLSAFGSWRTLRTERSLALLERQQAAAMGLAMRANMALHPHQTQAQLDADARGLAADIAAREHAAEIVRRGSGGSSAGFAARLEALARCQLEGLWLGGILLGTGDGGLAMQGGTTNPTLVTSYLSALAGEAAMHGVRFDRLAMHRALPEDAPARMTFELDAPGLAFPVRKAAP